ncbi:MAG: PQQ-binding-like beta-propeller repeat protein, partial [Actinomycetota bacterium]
VVSKSPAPGACCPVGGPAFVTKDTFAFQSFDSESGRFYLIQGNVATDVNDSRATPSIRGSLVYRGDKAFDASSGTLKQAWRADPSILYDGGFHSSPALGKDLLVVGSELGTVHFFALEGEEKVRKPVWQYKALGAGRPNGAVSSSPAVVDGGVFFGGEDGILYGLGKGDEAGVVDLPVLAEDRRPVLKPQGSEWTTPGGDMGFSYVSPDRRVKPPFVVEWKTRVWSTFKGPMIVADGKVSCAGRLGPFMALDAGSGEILWKTHHPGVESRPAPTYAAGKLLVMRVRAAQGDSPYISGASGGPPGEGLWCHDAATGQVLWHQPMSFKYHFNHDGLAVHEGKVFVERNDDPGGIQAVAYSIETGLEVWR